MRRLLTVTSLVFLICRLHAQNTIALPGIFNFSHSTYSAGTQNWNIAQDKSGVLYFANNEGLLTFDGTYWKTYRLPNRSIVRSVIIADDGRIYVGGQQEFGYFSPNQKGDLQYTSLLNLVPEQQREFADIWHIVTWKNQVFFRSGKRIFQYNNGVITCFNSIHWSYLGICNGMLIAKEFQQGFLKFENGVWTPLLINGQPLNQAEHVCAFLSFGADTTLLASNKHGLFFITRNGTIPFRSPDLDEVAGKFIYAATLIDHDLIALATNHGGCYIVNHAGQIVQHFSKTDGLQNNNILSIFVDRDKNIWLGLDNGIDFIAYNKAIKHITPEEGDVSSGYTAYIFNNHLYLGTSGGLYQVPINGSNPDLGHVKGTFKQVANTLGQVWGLNEVNGTLFMGHNDESFIVTPESATPFDNTTGFWNFQPMYPVVPSSIMAAGSYNGIVFYEYSNGQFNIKTKVSTRFESARYLCINNNTIWVAHPYFGLYRIQYNPPAAPTFKKYKDVNGILSLNRNYMYRIKSRIVLTTDKGFYEYNEVKDDFEPSTYFKSIFGDKHIQYLKEDPSGNIWFVQDKKLGVVDLSTGQPHLTYFPELNNKIMGGGYENIYPYNAQNIFVGAEEGFYLINYTQYIQNKQQLNILLRSVRAIAAKDSLISGGYVNDSNAATARNISFPHRFNAFRFQYSSPFYNQQTNVEYSYYLEGFDEKWSDWSKRTEKDYTSLHPGAYRFRVKARSQPGQESPEAIYSFRILPPWYLSTWAYVLYTLILISGIYLLYKRQNAKFELQQKKHEDQQKHLQYMHQLEIDRNEKEIVKLRNEKLEVEIDHKNKELASSAMHLVQKGELIGKLKDDLMRLSKTLDNEKAVDEFRKMIRMLDIDNKMDTDWEKFAQHFDTVHSDFLVEIKNRFPQLTANELKLCAFLRMNLTSKEIARLLNISIRGVEVSRYRLRKKLKLPTEINLYDYLLNPDMPLPQITNDQDAEEDDENEEMLNA